MTARLREQLTYTTEILSHTATALHRMFRDTIGTTSTHAGEFETCQDSGCKIIQRTIAESNNLTQQV